MKMQSYVDEIKLDVTGGILELEIEDSTIQQIVNSAMRELQRYICSTKIVTLPYTKCIDMTEYKVNAVARVYKAQANTASNGSETATSDPMAISMWQIYGGTGSIYNMQDALYNYAAYSTMQQISNTLSTDLSWYYEDAEKKLYINTTLDSGTAVTIEYVPRYDNVEDITSDYWIDILMRLSKALTKVTLARIRGRFSQSNALWTQDADTMLQEGQTELSEVRAHLQKNTQLLYAID